MNIRIFIEASNRVACPSLSSRARRFMTALLLGSAVMSVGTAFAQPITTQPAQSASFVAGAIYEWKTLQQSPSLSFSSYANFLVNNPGWPNETTMRKAAEKNLRAETETPSHVIAFFRRFAPLTPTGQLRFAEALSAMGMADEARINARLAWIGGTLSPDDESRFLTRYASAITPVDQDLRMEKLLWSRATATAARQLYLVSPSRRAVFEARLAMLTKAPDAALKRGAVESIARTDAGFIVDKVYWFRNTGNVPMARATLSNPFALSAPPVDPARWLNSLYDTAKNAANDQQWDVVWNIARQAEIGRAHV